MASNVEPSSVQLLQDIVSGIGRILRSEVKLAKVEFKEEISKGAKGSGVLGAGILFAFYALGFLLLTGVYALSLKLPLWSSALLVGLFAGTVATILIVAGRRSLTQVHLKPEKAIETVKENVEWMKQQTK